MLPRASDTKEDSPPKELSSGLIQGPRKKNAGTVILEYLIAAKMNGEKKFSFSKNERGNTIVTFKNKSFNLSMIIRFADYEQLNFSEAELASYASSSSHEIKKEGKLHPAEIKAIKSWSGFLSYTTYQNILRNSKLSVSLDHLLIICIASHGLQNPFFYKPSPEKKERVVSLRCVTQHTHSSLNKPLLNRGFTSSSTSIAPSQTKAFGDYTIWISEKNGLNPLGKAIHPFSSSPEEREILFPPNTEFTYQPIYIEGVESRTSVRAFPSRSLNTAKEFTKNLSKADLQEIKTDRLLYSFSTLLSRISGALKSFIPYEIVTLFFGSHPQHNDLKEAVRFIESLKKLLPDSPPSQLKKLVGKTLQLIMTLHETQKNTCPPEELDHFLKTPLNQYLNDTIKNLESLFLELDPFVSDQEELDQIKKMKI